MLELAHTVVLMRTTSRAYLELRSRKAFSPDKHHLIAAAKMCLLLVQGVFNCSSPFSVPRIAEPNGWLCYVESFFQKGALVGCYLFLILIQKIGRNT